MIDIHDNTVRLYEKNGFISKVARKENGYRIFTDQHIEEFKLARRGFKAELIQNGLRKKMIQIIRLTANEEYQLAKKQTIDYIKQLEEELIDAKDALDTAKKILYHLNQQDHERITYKRKEVLKILNISLDTLRNWEMNGLINSKKKANGYKLYTSKDIEQLKIIRSLRYANYSLSAILRMFLALEENPKVDITKIINSPEEEIIRACDQLLYSLKEAKKDAIFILKQLDKIQRMK